MLTTRLLVIAALLGIAGTAHAQATADQVLTTAGLSGPDKQRALGGEFVDVETEAVSERDLAVAIAFLVKTSPEALAKDIVGGQLVSIDSSVKAHGSFSKPGRLEDLKALPVSAETAKAFADAKAGGALNLSRAEIAAFAALQGKPVDAVRQQVQKVLLARYQAYRASGLAGIAPYDRGGAAGDLAADLRKASEAARALKQYLPAFHALLLGYPKATVPSMREEFTWAMHDIDGKITYVLTHFVVAPDGPNFAVLQRQFYVSTGYNGEQAVAGFLPVQGGTVVAYSGHAFTDQVAGFGGSVKRGVGRKVMASTLKKQFDDGRIKAQQ